MNMLVTQHGALVGVAFALAGCAARQRPAAWELRPSKTPIAPLSDPESALQPSGARVSLQADAVLADANRADAIMSATVDGRWSWAWGSGYLGWSYAYMDLHDLNPDDSRDLERENQTCGNLRAGLAVRRTSLPRVGGNAYRRALAVRLDTAAGWTSTDGKEQVLMRRPFDLMQFGAGPLASVTAEAHYELLGYLAPFVHIQAGLVAQHIDDKWNDISVPMSATVGLRPLAATWVFAELGAQPRHVPSNDLLNDAEEETVQASGRLRFGVDWDYAPVRPGVLVDIHLGDTDGFFFQAYLTWLWGMR